MKTTIYGLGMLLWLPTSYGGVIDLPVQADKRSSPHANLHSSFTDAVNGNVIHFLVEGYEGEVSTVQITKSFTPTYHYTGTKALAIRDLNERADVCAYITDCAGYLKDSTAYYAMQAYSGIAGWCSSGASAFSDYFSSNNYEHAKAVLDGAVASVALAVPLAVGGYYLNAKLAKLDGSSTQNNCGTDQPAVVAEQVASAMYEFCLSIKNNQMSATTTRFDVGDMSSSDDTFDGSDGRQLVSKFNIGSVEFDTLAVCQDYGISWRRDLAAAVLRGKKRSAGALLMPVLVE